MKLIAFSLQEPQLIDRVEHFFLDALANCRLIENVTWRSRPFWQRCLGRFTLFFRWQL
jgi:hypothetical protein